ncbi:MAG: hypothetical protein WBC44_01210, partial [Planctomycetaceae bacterium]
PHFTSPAHRSFLQFLPIPEKHATTVEDDMAKTNRKLNKANHGRRPASAKARKAKRRAIKT